MIDTLQDYRQEAERQYGLTIIRLIKSGNEQLQAEQLCQDGLTLRQREILTKIATRSTTPKDIEPKFRGIEREVCHILLYYLQTAIFVRDQQMQLVGWAILENEQKRWNLDFETAQAINKAVLHDQVSSLKAEDPQRWEQYDQLLCKAIQRDGIPLEHTQAQLKLLQLQLGMPDDQVPPAEKLQSPRGVNYILLWRMLKQGDWYAANEETRRCLVEAGGQQERDLQLIDINRISSPSLTADLETIDALWAEFSKGQFGFKKQRQLWQEVDPKLEDLEKLGKRLDWRRNNSWIGYDSVDFSKDAVPGHLPTFPHIGWWCWVGGMKAVLDQFPAKEVSRLTAG